MNDFRIEAKDVNILSAVQILLQSGIQWFHGSGAKGQETLKALP